MARTTDLRRLLEDAVLRYREVRAEHGDRAWTRVLEAGATVLGETRAFGEIALDTARFAAKQVRRRYSSEIEPIDPSVVADHFVLHLSNHLIGAKKAVALAIADEKRLCKDAEIAAFVAEEWARKGELARRAGDHGLAAMASEKHVTHAAEARVFASAWSRQRSEVERLKESLRALHERIERVKQNKTRWFAERRLANATASIRAARSQLESADDAVRLFERMTMVDAVVTRDADAPDAAMSGGDPRKRN